MATLNRILGVLKQGTGTVLKDTFRSDHEVIRSEEELPDPETVTIDGSGKTVIPLRDGVEYEIDGQVSHSYPIYGNGEEIYGKNNGSDILIYTGDDTQLIYRDDAFFVSNLVFMQTDNTSSWIDLEADNTTEFLARSIATASGGTIGTVDGYRVPVFEFCSFDNMQDGISYEGDPNKIFMIGCPIRNMADNGTAVHFGSTLTVEYIDISKAFLRSFGSGTTGFDLDGSATVSEIGIFEANIIDDSVDTKTSGFDSSSEGWFFNDNTGISDSGVSGVYTKDASTVTDLGDATDTYTKVTGATTAQGTPERLTHASPNKFTYEGERDTTLSVDVSLTLSGPQNDFAVAVFKNQSLVDGGENTWQGTGVGVAVNGTTFSNVDVSNGDEIEVYIKNVDDGTADPTVESMQVRVKD